MTTTAIAAFGKFNDNQVSAIETKKGKTVGTRVVFGGVVPASMVRKTLKAKNPKLTGKELTVKVNEVITGKNTLAWAELQIAVEGLREAGYTPDYTDARKSGATIRFAKPAEPKENTGKMAALAEANAKLEAEIAELKAMLLK